MFLLREKARAYDLGSPLAEVTGSEDDRSRLPSVQQGEAGSPSHPGGNRSPGAMDPRLRRSAAANRRSAGSPQSGELQTRTSPAWSPDPSDRVRQDEQGPPTLNRSFPPPGPERVRAFSCLESRHSRHHETEDPLIPQARCPRLRPSRVLLPGSSAGSRIRSRPASCHRRRTPWRLSIWPSHIGPPPRRRLHRVRVGHLTLARIGTRLFRHFALRTSHPALARSARRSPMKSVTSPSPCLTRGPVRVPSSGRRRRTPRLPRAGGSPPRPPFPPSPCGSALLPAR